MIKLLVKNGANIYAKNPLGLGMMHMGAQSDQAYTLAYFRSKGLSVNDIDSQGSTPLHCAFDNGSQIAIYYLLGWHPDLDA